MALGEGAINPDEVRLSDLDTLAAQLDEALGTEVGTQTSVVSAPAPHPAVPRTPPPSAASSAPSPLPKPTAQRARFAPLAEEPIVNPAPSNMDLLMDVSLRVSVELGRATLNVRDTLNLAPGNVVELDKLAGDPVDVLVNGRLIARGEVVVVDDQFGVRITEIVSPRQRVEATR
jgi:flagellar motor switch protein FliN/FliY